MDVKELLDALSNKRIVRFAKGGVVVGMKLTLLRCDPIVGKSSIFHQHDRRVRLRSSQLLYKRFALGSHIGWLHVWQTIDYKHSSIQLYQKLTDRLIHPPVSGKPKIDDRHVEFSSQDVGMNHARSTSTCAVCDARPIEYDRLPTRSQAFEACSFLDADL